MAVFEKQHFSYYMWSFISCMRKSPPQDKRKIACIRPVGPTVSSGK